MKGFKIWPHYFKGAAHSILVLTDYNNLQKFIETTYLSNQQIWWTQKLLQYDFMIDYYTKSNHPADALSWPLTNKAIEKKLVEQNWKILNKLQQSLLKNNHSLLNVNC